MSTMQYRINSNSRYNKHKVFSFHSSWHHYCGSALCLLLFYSAVAYLMLQVRISHHAFVSTFVLLFTLCMHVCITLLQLRTLTSSADCMCVCPGDTVLVFTCVTDTGRLIWTVNKSVDLVSFHSINQIKTIVTEQIFKLELVNVSGCLQLLHTMCYLIITEQTLLAWMVTRYYLV